MELDTGSAAYALARSVVEWADRRTGRDVRWDGKVKIGDRPASLVDTVVAFQSATDGLWLTEEQLANVRMVAEGAGIGPTDVAGLNARYARLVNATGDLATQAVRLTGPTAERPGICAPVESHLDRGLGTTFVQENFAELWNDCESGRLMPIESVPNPDFRYGPGPAASATRDALRELVDQREGQADLSGTAAALLQVPPDRRWAAMAELIPDCERLDDLDLSDVVHSFRNDFARAVEAGNARAGTPDSQARTAVRELVRNIADRPTSAMTGGPQLSGAQAIGTSHDPALTAARLVPGAESHGAQRPAGAADKARGNGTGLG